MITLELVELGKLELAPAAFIPLPKPNLRGVFIEASVFKLSVSEGEFIPFKPLEISSLASLDGNCYNIVIRLLFFTLLLSDF